MSSPSANANANPSLIRIRDNATIKELNIPKDKLQKLNKYVASANLSDGNRKTIIRKLTNGSPCCACGGIASLEIRYNVSDERQTATLVERYCDTCVKTVYQREAVL